MTGRVAQRGEEELQRKLEWGRQSLATLERELGAKPYLQGEQPTVSDLAIYAFVHLAGDAGLELPAHVARWCRRIEALPGYISVVAPHVLPLLGPSNPQVSRPSGVA